MPRSPWQSPPATVPPPDPALGPVQWYQPRPDHRLRPGDAPEAVREWLAHLNAGRLAAPAPAEAAGRRFATAGGGASGGDVALLSHTSAASPPAAGSPGTAGRPDR